MTIAASLSEARIRWHLQLLPYWGKRAPELKSAFQPIRSSHTRWVIIAAILILQHVGAEACWCHLAQLWQVTITTKSLSLSCKHWVHQRLPAETCVGAETSPRLRFHICKLGIRTVLLLRRVGRGAAHRGLNERRVPSGGGGLLSLALGTPGPSRPTPFLP